ncbi:helix-turn-helix domain-containing protein [Gordonibacter massiliensis (ex Traore et al. 2017)]|uniref:Helix-turn-helix domain-containing protein n=1 Tax=Gordonibacter massiliensis (ex Traore et al. 2017) TaxID=1841863 RepID=A0A842JL56_9ACTN|nr:helix-turn-helix domain-containing protein [Gordonibacter massiliensis (ex Traore et al. 2017)]MBC2889890.1 helix-turn-helix domain-containing protein [Gordonibacter massiliensis (ex Traore et al. 2017)]
MASNATARFIGQTVRAQRKERRMTQRQLAQAAGVSERFIASLELGDSTGVRLDKLLDVLDPLDLALSIGAKRSDEPALSPMRDGSQVPQGSQGNLSEYRDAFESAVARIKPPTTLLENRKNGWSERRTS